MAAGSFGGPHHGADTAACAVLPSAPHRRSVGTTANQLSDRLPVDSVPLPSA